MKPLSFLRRATGAAILLTTSALATQSAHAFGGEDPVFGNPWHHEVITKEAATAEGVGFSPDAAASVAWHADYVDSYLYNPLWWAKSFPQSGINRLKASIAQKTHLESLHFDDLFSTDKVNIAWRRYASGTFVGLVHAAEKQDVGAAHNVLGASLHAIQDFYSHSNWIDDPNRRNTTFFQTPRAGRTGTALYTGAYEHDEHMGVKHHGAYLPAAALFKQPGVEQVMDAACSPISPLSNEDLCKQFKLSKTGQVVRPEIKGIKVPNNILVVAPVGIAVDNTWIAELGVKERGLTDLTGLQAFQTARELAKQQSIQWLQTMEKAMQKAGYGDFWNQVKQNGSDQATREKQYEELERLPHTFLSAGPYPVISPAEEYYLRVTIKTATENGAGTDADIQLKADRQTYLLDWMPRKIPGLAVNDFEAGDTDSYVVGPFNAVPKEIEFYNNSASTGEVLGAAGHAFVNAVASIPGKVIGVFGAILGTQADHIATHKQLWMPQHLDALNGSQPFQIELNGEGEGQYRAHGTITKIGQDERSWQVQVKINSLECVKESSWDRGSNSDEPFLLTALTPLPGNIQPFRTEPFDDVDSGETKAVDHTFQPVWIAKGSGMLNLAMSAMEHDDESRAKRDQLFDTFVSGNEEATKNSRRNFLTAFGAAIAEDWRPAHLEVTAFSRLGRVTYGQVHNAPVTRWIKGKESAKFPLDHSKLRVVALTDELLPVLPPPAQNPTTPGMPNTPDNGTGTIPPTLPPTFPTPDVGTPDMDLSAWEGTWQTNIGVLTLKKSGRGLVGEVRQKNHLGIEVVSAGVEMTPGFDGVSVEGRWQAPGSAITKGETRWTLSADGNSFDGTMTREWLSPDQRDPWTGRRLAPGPNTGTGNTGTNPTIPTNPTNPNTGTGNGGVGTPGGSAGGNTGGGVPTIGGDFLPLETFEVKFDKVTLNPTQTQLELWMTAKNATARPQRVAAGTFKMVVTDVNGVGMTDQGNMYAYEGATAERVGSVVIEPKSEGKMRWIVEMPPGMAALKTLSVREGTNQAHIFDLSSLNWSKAAPVASFEGLKDGQAEFGGVTDIWDARFDGIRAGRTGGYEAFVTFKNVTEKLQKWTLGYSKVTLHDAAGEEQRAVGNTYLANTKGNTTYGRSITVEPDGEVKLRFVFQSPSTFKPTKIRIKDAYGPSQIEYPVTAR